MQWLDTPFLVGTTILLKPDFSCAPSDARACKVTETLRRLGGQVEIQAPGPNGTITWKDAVERPVASLPRRDVLTYVVRSATTKDMIEGKVDVSALSHWRSLLLAGTIAFGLAFMAVPWSRTTFWLLFGVLPQNSKLAFLNVLVPVTANLDVLRSHVVGKYLRLFLRGVGVAKTGPSKVLATISAAVNSRDDGEKVRIVRLVGASSDVRRAILEAGQSFANRSGQWTWGRIGRLPLHVDLERYPDGKISEAFTVQLAKFGIDNSDLAAGILKRGRVVFLIENPGKLKDSVAGAEVLKAIYDARDNVAIVAVPDGELAENLTFEKSLTIEITTSVSSGGLIEDVRAPRAGAKVDR